MCQVTADNFDRLYPEICRSVDNCCFVAFDCEFTALRPDANQRNSLFDTIQDRYTKLSQPPVHSIISQIGLSIFDQNVEKNTYSASTFNFYICPRSFASIDEAFVCQASSLEFLSRYKFDFNKFIYKGIPYLNQSQEDQLKEDLRNGVILNVEERNIPGQDEDRIRKICGELAVWISNSKVGDELCIDKGQIVSYVLHTEIRNKFSTLWTFDKEDGELWVKIVTGEERKRWESEESGLETGDKLVDTLLGFSKLMRHVSKSGKPLVGHNCLLDLIKIYHQFFGPLPKKYNEFKDEIHKMFPVIYDTKNICFNTQKKISKIHPHLEHIFTSSNLNDLHKLLEAKDDSFNLMWKPRILHAPGFEDYASASTPHEAGYDAYLAGFCFIRSLHLAATVSYLDIKRMRVLAFHELLRVASEHQNHINLARAVTHHVNLGGEEPPSGRPPLLWVTSRGGSSPLDTALLADTFSRFACSDIRRVSRSSAQVAVSSFRGARDLLTKFREHPEWRLEVYSAMRHSLAIRRTMWTCVILGSVTLASIMIRHLALRK